MIYGGGGAIGGAAARVFAREGARVFLAAGRTLESLEETAEQIGSAGGAAETAQVDALDEQAPRLLTGLACLRGEPGEP